MKNSEWTAAVVVVDFFFRTRFFFTVCLCLYCSWKNFSFCTCRRSVSPIFPNNTHNFTSIKFSTTKNNPPSVSAKNTICYNVEAAKCLWKKCARLGYDEMLAWKNSYIRRMYAHTHTHWRLCQCETQEIDEARTQSYRVVSMHVWVSVCWRMSLYMLFMNVFGCVVRSLRRTRETEKQTDAATATLTSTKHSFMHTHLQSFVEHTNFRYKFKSIRRARTHTK